MTLSRLNNLKPHGKAGRAAGRGRAAVRYVPLASAISAILAGAPAAYAQQATGALEEVVVTAQKRSENMQSVPVAIIALGEEKLEELHVTNLDDYVKYLPSVSYSRGQGQGGNGQPGSSHVYMRGVVSGANENHSGSQPSVGTYLDEQPVTTIDGTVDVHVYDIARVEVLEGPQGTLYGASSQAGTIRIITNKPDPSKFSAGYDVSLDSVRHGGIGYAAEGFVNLPLSPIAAVRLVAWDEHDAGFIDNVAGTNRPAGIVNGVRNYPTWSSNPGNNGSVGQGSISNAAYVKNNYNTAETKGGRAALKLNLGDWVITPTVMGQGTSSQGFFGYDPVVGDLQLAHFGPENSNDTWVQTALTVEGKVANLDVVYAGAFMKRDTHSIADYSDYSFFYDQSFGSGAIWLGNNGLPIMPQELVVTKGYFEKFSHELRFSTPQQYPVKATFGAFVQRQLHDIYEDYQMPGYGFTNPYGGGNPNGLADSLSIPTIGNTIWLTDEQRVDRDQAAFAQVTWDISDSWAATVGYRYFKTDNTLQGFYGFSTGFEQLSNYGSGMMSCGPVGGPTVGVRDPVTGRWDIVNPQLETYGAAHGWPCQDLDKEVKESGHVPRYNLTYKFSPDKMIYYTYSKGFRPGGVNRNGNLPPYAADFLTNNELGWKTQWLGHHLRWNGAIFQEDWNNFQFSFLGQNSLTIINNGGSAKIKGVETELEWAFGNGLFVSASGTLVDPRLTSNYCGFTDPNTGKSVTTPDCTYPGELPGNGFSPLAPTGANLPIAPKFKANSVVRYVWTTGSGWDANVQGAFVYQSQTAPALKTADQQVIGKQPAYGLFDLSSGMERNGMNIQLAMTNVLDRRAELSRFVQCTVSVCNQPYIIPAQPRTLFLKFGQKF